MALPVSLNEKKLFRIDVWDMEGKPINYNAI